MIEEVSPLANPFIINGGMEQSRRSEGVVEIKQSSRRIVSQSISGCESLVLIQAFVELLRSNKPFMCVGCWCVVIRNKMVIKNGNFEMDNINERIGVLYSSLQ
jgi:hypothetical protein